GHALRVGRRLPVPERYGNVRRRHAGGDGERPGGDCLRLRGRARARDARRGRAAGALARPPRVHRPRRAPRQRAAALGPDPEDGAHDGAAARLGPRGGALRERSHAGRRGATRAPGVAARHGARHGDREAFMTDPWTTLTWIAAVVSGGIVASLAARGLA